MTMVLLDKLHINYMEAFTVTKRTENRLVERIAEVMLSDIVMDNEETTISMDGVLSIFAGIGGLGWKLYEERQLDYSPSDKADSVATYARKACRRAFPNLNKGEADKIAAALLALLAWLVDHLPKASDTELAMHLFGQASHISPKYFAQHLPYKLLRAYDNKAEEMAMWLLNNAVAAEMPPEQKAVPQSDNYWYVDQAIKERNVKALETYRDSFTQQLIARLDSNIQHQIQRINAAIIEFTRPITQNVTNYGNINERVEHQINTELPLRTPIHTSSATV